GRAYLTSLRELSHRGPHDAARPQPDPGGAIRQPVCRRHGHQGGALMRFESGNTFGKNGRPRGAKNKLHRSFVEALAKDFEEHGEGAIVVCRVEEPTRYLQIIASILTCPKNFCSRTSRAIWTTNNWT